MFVCIRIPRFAAWAMAQADLSLSSRVFAVCEQGKIVAPCPRALEAGIREGMSVGKARARLDDLHIVARDKAIESLAWQELQHALYGLTPQIEAIRPGLLFCDVHHEKLTYLLHQWDGGRFGVGAGCAGDRATAHLAALQAVSGSTRVVKSGRDGHFGGGIELKTLVGEVKPETVDSLAFFGWRTLGMLRPLSRRQLEEQFDGKNLGKDGETLFRFAQGAKCQDNLRPISTWKEPAVVAARIDFESPATQPCEWNAGLVDALTRACIDLGVRGAQSLEITAQTPLARYASRRLVREPSNQPKTLLRPLQSALEEALRLMAPLPVIVQSFEVRLGHLSVPELQPELWDDPRATRSQKLLGAVENVESRLPGKVLALVPAQPESPFEEERWAWLPALEKLGAKRHAAAK